MVLLMTKEIVYITYYNDKDYVDFHTDNDIFMLADKYDALKINNMIYYNKMDFNYELKNIIIANSFVLEISQYLINRQVSFDIIWGKENRIELRFNG